MHSPSIIPRLIAALLKTVCFLILSATVNAQSNTSIQGEVTDQAGAVIPNARVTIRSEAIAVDRSVGTDAGGRYLIAALPVGSYRIEPEPLGFKRRSLRVQRSQWDGQ